MINADMGPLDTRGRAVAHFFFDELEKIAKAGLMGARRAPHALRELGQFEINQARRATDAMPAYKRWFSPTSWKAHRQAKGRAGQFSGELQKNIRDAEAIMANPRAGAADREAAISYLEAAKVENPNISMSGSFAPTPRGGAVAPDFARQQQLSGASREGDFAKVPAASPLAQKAKMVGGGLALGAAGTLAGQQYLQHKANQTGGYGGY